ncbi:MAG: serine/threonine protein kinase [Myxococcales bacterium]|nr:serine/threonine protein kinase [Myxococcales bacterium]
MREERTPPRLLLQQPDSAETTEGSLPANWQGQAAARVGYLAGVATVVGVIAGVLAFFRQANVGVRAAAERPVVLIPIGIALSVAMLVLARSPKLAAARKVDLGLLYLVLMCAVGSYFRHALPYSAADVVRGVSPVNLAIVIFAVLVPVTPARMALTATAAALMDPMALGLTIFRGAPSPPWNLWLWLFAPNVISVGLAIVTSRMLFVFGRRIRQAERMGSYRLTELLGRGGMGEVWRAEHSTLARPAAIKLIRPETLTASSEESLAMVLKRFEREAQATAQLSSPHTIELYDYGVADDGSFYFVMELLEGKDLEWVLEREKSLSVERTVCLLEQVCESLSDAHQSGIVHRDIKPANIFVCRKGGQWDYVKVLDFGIAKQRTLDAAETRVTKVGSILGTPAYMAPEAILGQEVDGRADIYALGCVAYRMLSGRDVFEGKDSMGQLASHLQLEPPALHELTNVTPKLADLVMRCLKKAPAERPSSAEALLAELQSLELERRWTHTDAARWWGATLVAEGQSEAASLPFAPTVAVERS